jgi:hypothetical protein
VVWYNRGWFGMSSHTRKVKKLVFKKLKTGIVSLHRDIAAFSPSKSVDFAAFSAKSPFSSLKDYLCAYKALWIGSFQASNGAFAFHMEHMPFI